MKCNLGSLPIYDKGVFFDYLINHNAPKTLKEEKQLIYYDHLIYVPKTDNDYLDLKNYSSIDYRLVESITNSNKRFCYIGLNCKINGLAFGLFQYDYEYQMAFQFATIYLVNRKDFKDFYYNNFKVNEDA